jgi:hypothetical protein
VSGASIRRICSATSVPTRALFLWFKLIVGGSGWVRGAVRGVRDAIARGSGGGEERENDTVRSERGRGRMRENENEKEKNVKMKRRRTRRRRRKVE